jgi:transposase
MIDEVLPRLSRGDTVVVDNQNYHVMGKWKVVIAIWPHEQTNKGKHAERIVTEYANNGISYLRLPTYSPELNPIELVWGYLKSQLAKVPIHESLIHAVFRILRTISKSMMVNWYQKCGYLKPFWTK